ncbi:MAG: ATP-binding protein [Streptosporangiaceae bacterium]
MSECVHMGTFPGTADQAAAARKLVASAVAPEHPCHDDMVLLTSELATNAIRHTGSGREASDGEIGSFMVAVTHSDAWARVEVADAGSETVPFPQRPPVDATRGRGLLVVDALATRWGVTRDIAGTQVWFEVGDRNTRP